MVGQSSDRTDRAAVEPRAVSTLVLVVHGSSELAVVSSPSVSLASQNISSPSPCDISGSGSGSLSPGLFPDVTHERGHFKATNADNAVFMAVVQSEHMLPHFWSGTPHRTVQKFPAWLRLLFMSGIFWVSIFLNAVQLRMHEARNARVLPMPYPKDKNI